MIRRSDALAHGSTPAHGHLIRGAALLSLVLLPAGLSAPARAMSLDQACATDAQKLNAAVAAGDTQKAQTIYQQGRERIASRFGGATCPNVKPPG